MKQKFPNMKDSRVSRLFNSCLTESSDTACLTPRSFQSLVIKWDLLINQEVKEIKEGLNTKNMTDWEYLEFIWTKSKYI